MSYSIGKYRISDWHHKEYFSSITITYEGCFETVYIDSYKEQIYWKIIFYSTKDSGDFANAYYNIYTKRNNIFSSRQEGVDHFNNFLYKFDRLKIFL